MRIQYKTDHEIELQRAAGLVAAEILEAMCVAAKVGTSTWELDQIARQGIAKHAKLVDIEVMEAARAIRKLVDGGNPDKAELDRLTRTYSQLRAITRPNMSGAEIERVIEETARYHRVISAFLGYAQPPYPAVVCTSINEEIVHGIPSKTRVLKDGDIIGIDFGIGKQGYCADSARTIMVGEVSPEKKKLVDTTREALNAAIDMCRIGNRIGDIGSAVQKYAEERGYSVVRQFVGHGIGQRMHEEPAVPNFGAPNEGKRLKRGLVIAVEPMVNAGAPDVDLLDDGWTAVTRDRRHSAHFEHTIAILDEGPWVLTRASSTPGDPGHD